MNSNDSKKFARLGYYLSDKFANQPIGRQTVPFLVCFVIGFAFSLLWASLFPSSVRSYGRLGSDSAFMGLIAFVISLVTYTYIKNRKVG
jgi:Na+(H+)/acetate symporter ActP